MKYKCQCGEVIDSGANHYCRAYPDKLLARIAELEAEVIQYKAELDRVLEAHKKAIARLVEWSPELAQDFVTLLLMDLQKKE